MAPIETPLAQALNHLLRAEPWARGRLAPFAGETFAVHAAPFAPLRLRIAEAGLLEAAADTAPIALTLALGASAMPALARGEDHFLRAVEVNGNAQLANELLFLARHLRWDWEEDLSRWVGDAAAHRLAEAARQAVRLGQEAVERIASDLAAYLIEERQLLVRRDEWSAFGRELAELRDAIARAEARLGRLG